MECAFCAVHGVCFLLILFFFIIIIITLSCLDLLFDAAVKQCIDSAVEEGF